jgi:purine-nucleoside phosphorylase
MNNEQLKESLDFIRSKIKKVPKIGLVLGSGLGSFADTLENKIIIDCKEIPHYPPSTVEGHEGKLVFGYTEDVYILAQKGRVHYYEGYTMDKVTYAVRLMGLMGIKNLIVTNASGGLNPNFNPGDLMIITDHVNMMFANPLTGPNDEKIGPRFPDMSEPYSKEYIELAEETALELGIKTRRGVLWASTGPTYETKSEVKMAQKFGGDSASMSTVPEVIVANHMGMKVLGISCITNYATGISNKKLDHTEVMEVAEQVKEKFIKLVKAVIKKIAGKIL